MAVSKTSPTANFFDEPSDQSKVKARIVSNYFKAWANVITAVDRSSNLVYIDLYSGTGKYGDGTASTPLLVLQHAIQHEELRQRLVAIFNDASQKYLDALQKAIDALPGVGTLTHKPRLHNYTVGEQIVRQLQSIKLSPTLLFLDPWGYKGLRLDLVNSVIRTGRVSASFFSTTTVLALV